MIKKINTENFESGAKIRLFFEPVKKCPLCHAAFNGETMTSAIAPYEFVRYNGEKKREWALYVLHYCQVCCLGFCGIYLQKAGGDWSDSGNIYTPVIAVPEKVEPPQFDPEIVELSRSFVNIFEEAYAAEKNDLTLICGMGYRKALEFLVKDYLISKFPQNADTIAKEPLAQSIRRIDNPKIKILAERSAWLGNDETHYIKKHEEYSYNDIKSFLDAMIAFILYDKMVEKALSIPRQ